MGKPVNMIVFGEDWGALPTSTQHLIRNMPNRGRVFWVNSVGLRSPEPTLGDAKRLVSKASARLFGPASGATDYAVAAPLENMEIIEPNVLPFHRSAYIRRRNGRNLREQLAPFVESCGDNPPVIWITVPTADVVLDEFPDLPSIYYVCDDFETLPGVDHVAALEAEQRIAPKVDCIVATNQMLSEKFPAEKTTYIPHGVDFDNFALPAPKADDLPEGPVAGFFGLLAEWVDQDLLVATARALGPEGWTVLVIGKPAIDTDISKLEAEPNIQCVGTRPYDQLASYAQHWDISLLPFTDTPDVHAMNPLKLREYLACGAPIVTTPFQAATPYGDWMTITYDYEEWFSACREALNDAADGPATRQAVVREESWAARAGDIIQALRG